MTHLVQSTFSLFYFFPFSRLNDSIKDVEVLIPVMISKVLEIIRAA